MIGIKKLTVQQWLPIEKIYSNGIIKLKKNKFIKILRINPINYNLKSDLEKNAILNAYKIFLKTCDFDIQILIQSNKENLKNHILNIEKNIQKKENKYLKNIADDYIKYINKLNLINKASTKDFYLIIFYENKSREKIELNEIIENNLKEKYFKIKECLARCGNEVSEIFNSKEIINIFYSFLNTRKNNKKEIKEEILKK
ncbi:MAG: hypothetical protein IKF97_05525 [Clostridia bacterium]|nr:hypothetical protein [Clostridia bacterium]